jgi:asparagine synthetase B (glutamine-hydrolysing)
MTAFTMLGFNQEPENLLKRRFSDSLGVVPRIIDFGDTGHFFFHTSYGDVAETEEAIALKLGFVRSRSKCPLSSQQLLHQELVTPRRIDHDALRGNTLIACLSKTKAEFVVFKNLVSLPQLYYWKSGNQFMAADNLRCLIAAIGHVELNQDIIPYHFMFRHAPGTLTYFRNVERLFPGQLLQWREGNLEVRRVQNFRFPDSDSAFERVDWDSANAAYEELQNVVGAYIRQIEEAGHSFGNLLSGGVDSSILQLIIDQQIVSKPARSFSSAPTRTPSFEFEIEYARQASELLETEHTLIQFSPEDYPSLIVRAVEALGQPVLSDVEPTKLAIAEFLAKHESDRRFFFVGQGADTLFGLGMTQKLKLLSLFRRVPGSPLALATFGRLSKPFTAKGLTMLKAAEILTHAQDPHLFVSPTNTITVYSNLDIARRCFGDDTLRQVLEYRRNWEIEYLDSADYTEKVHVIDLLSDTYEIQVQSGQLFLTNDKEQIYPYMDEDIVRLSFAFRPEIRYIKGWRTKPILKDILEQRDLHTIARKPKGSSNFTDDLYAWMHAGPLYEMVREIDRPAFLGKADFEQLVDRPDHFLWSLLTFDIFRKRILKDAIQ